MRNQTAKFAMCNYASFAPSGKSGRKKVAPCRRSAGGPIEAGPLWRWQMKPILG
jgi:hypothetical protein